MDSKKTIIKKKKIIISLCLISILLLIAIVTFVIILVHNSKKEKQESEGGNVGTLYSEENLEGEEGVLEVDIDEPSIMTEEPKDETQEDNKTVKNDTKPKKVDAPYYIKVNNQANVVTVYKKDSHGKYTVPIKAMICSIGSATPESGTYSMSDKYTWRLLEGNVYGQYACRITGSILFHSVPYEQKDKTTLEWWEYDKLGVCGFLLASSSAFFFASSSSFFFFKYAGHGLFESGSVGSQFLTSASLLIFWAVGFPSGPGVLSE